MKNFRLTLCLIISIPVAGNAENFATITNVTPNYSYTKSYTQEKSCHIIEEPIYGNISANVTKGGDVLTGLVLGGLLGKGVTGKDKGAAAGAVLGGIIASSRNNTKSTIIGYRKIPNCEIVQSPQTIKTIKNYRIDYEWGGIFGSSYTYNNYHIGQHIPISVNIIAK